MNRILKHTIVILLFLVHFAYGQSIKKMELSFATDNGFEGIALLETTFYVEESYKVKIELQQFQITGYNTSIGRFTGTDLRGHGVTFPIECKNCSFRLKGQASAFFTDKAKSLSIPVKTLNYISANSNLILTVPFEISNDLESFEQTRNDWEQTGELSDLRIRNLEGAILDSLIHNVRKMAKDQADEIALNDLIAELQLLDQKVHLKKLYQSRSQFYNKASIDSLITKVQTGQTNELGAYSQKIVQSPVKNEEIIPEEAKTIVAEVTDQIEPEKDRPVLKDSSFESPSLDQLIEIDSNYENSVTNETITLEDDQDEKPSAIELSQISDNKVSSDSQENNSLSNIIEEAPILTLAEIVDIEPKKEQKQNNRKRPKKLSKLDESSFEFSTDVSKYKRSSLHTIMLQNPGAEQANVIEETFLNRPLPEKFNTHPISTNFISVARKARKQDKVISEYLSKNDIAKEVVAKWFNRNEKGEFNMDLVAERGHYNASVFDLSIARKSERGLAMLADAGEQLIANTFVIVNDYKYTNKEEVAKKSGFFTSLVSAVATAAGADDIALIADAATITTGVVGKGYIVKVTSYLYRLKWDDKIANTFYENFWVDANNFNPEKKAAFDMTTIFELELVGYETDFSGVQSSAFTSKSDAELIQRATVKATDQTITKLQRKFEIFRTKTPLISTAPLAAKIGLKEGVEKGDKFEVLEQYLEDDGTTGFKRVGVIKVDKNHIWDNRYKAYEENNQSYEYTTFTGGKNRFYQGMLIRQIN